MEAVIDIKYNDNGATGKVDKLTSSVGDTVKQTKSLRTQLREMTQELAGMEAGTAEFNRLAKAAGDVKDQMQDTAAVIQATAGSAVENLATGLSKVGGVGVNAFQGIAGAQALFGSDSEELMKVMAQLQGAMAVGEALKGFGALGDTITEVSASFGALLVKLGLKTTATVADTAATTTNTVAEGANATAKVAQAGATTTATVAQNALNASMLANPIFLVIAGIAALAGAIALFGQKTEVAEAANKRLNKQLDDRRQKLDSDLGDLSRIANENLRIAEIEGKSVEEIAELKRRVANQDENAIKSKQIFELGLIQQKTLSYKKYLREENFTRAAEIAKEIKAAQDKYKALGTELKNFYSNSRVFEKETTAKIDTDKEAKAKEATDKAKAAQEKAKAEKEKALGEIAGLEKAYLDSKLSAQDLEIKKVREKYADDLANAKKYGQDQTTLLAAQQAELDGIKEKYFDKDRDRLKTLEKVTLSDNILKHETKINELRLKLKSAKGLEILSLSLQLYKQENDLLNSQEQEALSVIGLSEAAKFKIVSEYALKRKDLQLAQGIKEDVKADPEVTAVDKKIEAYNKLSETLKSVRGDGNALFNDFSTIGLQAISAFTELADRKFSEGAEGTREKVAAYTEAIGSALSSLTSAIAASEAAASEEKIKGFESEAQAEKDALQRRFESGLIQKADYDKAITDLEKASQGKILEEKKKAFEIEKKSKRANAVIAGAQGAVQAFAGAMSLGPIAGPIVGGILAASVAAMAALNISKIDSSKFEGGGGTGGGSTPSIATATPNTALYGSAGQANTFGSTQNTGNTSPGIQGVVAVVSATEITSAQNLQNKLEYGSKL